ncbi:MAG: hypothetical protein LRZ84_25520 [Desertifilum sp.]|nr:hypothetical protein [Desertifilum sp.]
MTQLFSSLLSRRYFLSYMALGGLSLIWNPASAIAGSEKVNRSLPKLETYHIVVPFATAKIGGIETFLLRSGETCRVDIPPRTQESDKIAIADVGLEGQDIQVIVHTLYDRQSNVGGEIRKEIQDTPYLQQKSKDKCINIYENLEDQKDFDDLISLAFLDYIISSSSKLDSQIQERYQLASENSRLVTIQQALEETLAQSNLSELEQKQLKGTYAYVRAGEPVPDFNTLTYLDTIIAGSNLPLELTQRYSLASANSRALTVDLLIIQAISEAPQLNTEQQNSYLSTYQLVRAGEVKIDEAELTALDSFISSSNLLDEVKEIYSIARQQNIKKYRDLNLRDTIQSFLQEAQDLKEFVDKAEKRGSALVPNVTKFLSSIGVETATGVTISKLSGAAATNATLAFLGGGSVASGGFGMLGGLAVATGGAALIGAAGLLSIAFVSQMDKEDQRNLGVAVSTGALTGATSVLGVWSAASALGAAGTTSGAAAISSIMAALGGISMITGGAAFVASTTAFLVWSALSNSRKRNVLDLNKLEARMYTFNYVPEPKSIENLIQNKLLSISASDRIYYAPDIPLDKLISVLAAKWLSLNLDEQVLILVDNSSWLDSTQSVVFTDRRLLWPGKTMQYQDLASFFDDEQVKFLSHINDKKQKDELEKLSRAISILENDSYNTNLSQLKELVSILDEKPGLEDLLKSQKDKKTLGKLKQSVEILLNPKSSEDLIQLKEVMATLSSLPDFIKFLPSGLANVFSDEGFRDSLFQVGQLIALLPRETKTEVWVEFLQSIGQKYS